ncbi:MAG: polyprenyl synthetase family protein [Candidatus Coatesbacteria bacterium]|nr:polyprenyl synthetase family protein [Candidatus Coatesbacteria bacterium]
MTYEEVFRDVAAGLREIQSRMQAILDTSAIPVDDAFKSTIKYPGKLLRPGLLLLSAKSGKEPALERAIALGCSVEMLHVATLLHDDVIDGSCLRRQMPTAARSLGDNCSVLLGDYLFARSLKLLAESREFDSLLPIARAVEACAEGELLEQANLCNLALGIDEYMLINEKKTARLFEACCRLGATLGAFGDMAIESLAEFGLHFGLGFQIIDDLLDFVGDIASLGKPIYQDLAHGVITLPTILALSVLSDGERDELDGLFSCHADRPSCAAPLEYDREKMLKLREFINSSGALEATLNAARGLFDEAKKMTERPGLPDILRSKLDQLCSLMLEKGQIALAGFRESTTIEKKGLEQS